MTRDLRITGGVEAATARTFADLLAQAEELGFEFDEVAVSAFGKYRHTARFSCGTWGDVLVRIWGGGDTPERACAAAVEKIRQFREGSP